MLFMENDLRKSSVLCMCVSVSLCCLACAWVTFASWWETKKQKKRERRKCVLQVRCELFCLFRLFKCSLKCVLLNATFNVMQFMCRCFLFHLMINNVTIIRIITHGNTINEKTCGHNRCDLIYMSDLCASLACFDCCWCFHLQFTCCFVSTANTENDWDRYCLSTLFFHLYLLLLL